MCFDPNAGYHTCESGRRRRAIRQSTPPEEEKQHEVSEEVSLEVSGSGCKCVQYVQGEIECTTNWPDYCMQGKYPGSCELDGNYFACGCVGTQEHCVTHRRRRSRGTSQEQEEQVV